MADRDTGRQPQDTAPGDPGTTEREFAGGLKSYLVGFSLSVLLTAGTFWIASGSTLWTPAVPVALVALAVAQIGVHLVFFLHITSGPDSTNNALALAFGSFIVILVIGGSIWIMSHLNANMPPMHEIMDMQR